MPIAVQVPTLADWKIIAAYVIFLISYVVFALGKLPGMKIDRPGMAIIGAVAMVACRVVRPGEALRFIDFGTIVLLFAMMLLVGYLHLAGFFEWITELIVAHLPPRRLLPTVIFTSGILSAFFVNDIICLVMVPFVLTVTRRFGVKPVPYLLAVATASNIGSVGTITGNPQNMLIGSFSRIAYRDFLVHLGPVALLGLLLDWAVLYFFVPRSPLPVHRSGTGDTNGNIPDDSRVDSGYASDLARTAQRPTTANGKGKTHSLRKPAIVIALVLAGFIAGVPPAQMAALGAAVMLITRTREPQHVYEEVNWDLLVFFVGLFLIVGGAENAGLTERLFAFTERWNLQNAGVFSIATAVLSNIVSNVPAVMLLKSLVPSFRDPHTGWLLLAMASTLAGNLTITGSVANLIVVERARGYAHIGFWDYFKIGFPVTVLTLALGWAWLSLVPY